MRAQRSSSYELYRLCFTETMVSALDQCYWPFEVQTLNYAMHSDSLSVSTTKEEL